MEEKAWVWFKMVVESAFFSIKRTFGEYISAVKWKNIVNEMLLNRAALAKG